MTGQAVSIRVSRDERRGRFFWYCRHCPVDTFGWAATVAEASNAAWKHLPNCPAIIRGLDALLADALAVPEYRHVTFGRTRVVFCVACERLVDDQDEHTANHLAGTPRGVIEAVLRG